MRHRIAGRARAKTSGPDFSLPLLLVAALAGVFASGLLVACTPDINYQYSREPDPRKTDYVLGPSDTIHINVWKNPELSTDSIVRPDGTVTMSLIGDIRAAGRTTRELREEIAHRLSAFLKSEEIPVTVAVTSVNSYRFTVSGNVEHGGIYSPKYYVTVSDALALSGGLNKFANGDRITIVRTASGKQRRIPIIYSQIQNGAHPEMDIVILSGDTILVP
jgi:polysaccharide export outer membrane protein